MWRTRAIRSLLLEEIAGLARSGAPDPPSRTELRSAQRRARLVVAFDWLAIAALFLLRDPGEPWLQVRADIETVFSLGIVAVAVHSGFRLGQLDKLRSVERALDELEERDGAAS